MSTGTPPHEGLLHGRRVLVTGGSSGIGQGICDVVAREGAKVAFTYSQNAAGADATAAMIRAHGVDALAIKHDLRDKDAPNQVVTQVEAAWGGIDALVNNAAVSEAVPFVLIDDDEWDDLFALNVTAIEGMTRSLAHELGRYDILTNCVAAGIFEGGLRSTIPEHHQKRYVDSCALNRIGTPAECGELVAWLASSRNTYLNGAVIVLDGGTLA